MTVTAFCKRFLRLAKTNNQQGKQTTTKQVFTGRHRSYRRSASVEERLLLQVKCIALFLLASSFVASANGFTQDITINRENVSLQTVFKEIERQSDYRFFYNESLLQQATKVTVQVQHVSLEEALAACFKNQPLYYSIIEKTIIVKRREISQPVAATNNPRKKLPIVKGIIEDNKGPVAGATVTVMQTNEMTTTNAAGVFSFTDVEETSTLSISSVSHLPIEIGVKGQPNLSIKLQEKVGELDDAVIVAYSTTTQRRATGAFSIVKGDEVKTLPNRSVDKSLQGLVPGLLVTGGTGQPGGGLANFVLRGIATGDNGRFGSTLRNPLIVVDGIPVSQDPQQLRLAVSGVPYTNPMAQLNPSDIETITVLKDAAAIALYGSKAANGVILITTKKGKAGKTKFNFRHQSDIAQRLDGKVKLLNQQQYLELLYETYRNTTPGITDEEILNDIKTIFPTRADGSFYPQEDLADQVYTKNAATIVNELSISGGNERSNYYFSLEWTNQNGIYKKAGYDRRSMRFNFENRPVKWFTYGMNVGLSYNVQDYIDINNDPNTIITMSSPLQPVRDESGNFFLYFPYLYNASNPVAMLEYNMNKNTGYRALTKLYAGINFLDHFKFTSNFGVDFGLIEAKEKYDPRLYDPITISTGQGRIEEGSLRNTSLITTNTLVYDNTFAGKHNLNILAGQEAQILTQRNIGAEGYPLQLPYYNQVDNTSYRDGFGNSAKQTLVSYFGQVNYGYKNKYFISFSTRLDGSSKFGADQQYGSFWSAGTGWVITEEGFMQKAQSWLNYLKIRGSLGKAGNSGAITRFIKYDVLQNYLFNYSVPGVYPVEQPANPEIKWEQTFTLDGGLEARFLNNRIVLTADIYRRKTSDVIYLVNLANVSGYQNMLANIGDMENKGTEISLSVDIIRSKNFKWNFQGNLSANKNKLLKANVSLSTLTSGYVANEEGRNFNSFYMRRWAGVNPADGSAQYIDSTGKANSDVNAAKQVFVGKPQPDGFGAITNTFSYKQWGFSFMLYYQYGFQVYDNFSILNDGSLPYSNQDIRALDRWKKPGDNAANPVRTLYGSSGYEISTRRLYNGDYIRLQNININYNFSNTLLKKLHLNSLQLFAQAYNVAIWTKFPGADISNANIYGNSTFNYPNAKTYSIGINAGF